MVEASYCLSKLNFMLSYNQRLTYSSSLASFRLGRPSILMKSLSKLFSVDILLNFSGISLSPYVTLDLSFWLGALSYSLNRGF